MTQAPATPSLVERLNYWPAHPQGADYSVASIQSLMRGAADALEAQQARIAELEEDRDNWRSRAAERDEECERRFRAQHDAQALADRYEKALREVRARTYSSDRGCALKAEPVAEICDLASQALSSSQGRHEGGLFAENAKKSIPELPGVNAVPLPASPDGTRNIERLPASDLTDRELLEEQGRVEKLWDQMHEPDDDGELFEGHGGSPGEWMVERMDEIATEQARRAALPSPNPTNPEAEHG